MSIAAPNYDKLPSRQAELRQRDREVEKAQESAPPDALAGRGRKDVVQPWAVCHPKRRAVNSDLICRPCLNLKMARATRADMTPEQALEKQTKEGAGKLGEKALAYLQTQLPEFARDLVIGSKVAAAKGDTRPAEWALTHVKAGDSPIVTPPAKEGGGGSTKIFIGLQIGGLPPGVQTQAITVPVEQVVPAEGVGSTEHT